MVITRENGRRGRKDMVGKQLEESREIYSLRGQQEGERFKNVLSQGVGGN